MSLRITFGVFKHLATFVQVIVYATLFATRSHGGPVVSLDYATFEGAAAGGVDSFLGIPYAQPPVGDLRFRRPKPPLPLPNTTLATTFGNACLQVNTLILADISNLNFSLLAPFSSKVNASEDCLYANVFRPANISAESKLPVVAWFFGGAFESGDGSFYDGSTVVNRSVELGEPVIYVNFNYRLNAFGWLAGKEALAAGAANNGLHDQILFLTWVKTYISQFGGDPNKITVWGQSAGALSITAHLVMNSTKPLFQAAILQSGYTFPIYKTDSQKHQATYDHLVQFAGCSLASDTFECLRTASLANLTGALTTTAARFPTSGVDITWSISIDGELMNKSMNQYVDEGSYTMVPILGGEVDDEGTYFSLYREIKFDDDVKNFSKAHLFQGATDDQVNSVLGNYSKDFAAGSPFDTGNTSALTPEFKRLAAIQGDHTFQAGRRLAFSKWAATQNVWSYLWKRDKKLLYLGSYHAADLSEMYGFKGDHLGTDAIVNFINNQDPNYPNRSTALSPLSNITWPKYTLDSKEMLLFSDNVTEEYTTIPDTYRADGIAAIIEVQKELGV